MLQLVTDMVQDDPSKRPTMDEVIVRFDEIVRGLSSWKLRSSVIGATDSSIAVFFRSIPHWRRRLQYISQRIPPIPIPSPNGKSCFLSQITWFSPTNFSHEMR
jgi:hypothetical protein